MKGRITAGGILLFFILATVAIIQRQTVHIAAPIIPPSLKGANLIIISVDSLRTDHMSLYGYDRQTTSAIDTWARGGVVFDKNYSTSYLTPIAEESVQTGLNPAENGVVNFESSLKAFVRTLPELLRAGGYQTAAFGTSPEFVINDALKGNFSRGFDTYQPYDRPANPAPVDQGRDTDAPITKSIAWLKNIPKKKPFFLWIPLGGVHWPYGSGFPHTFSDPNYHGMMNTASADDFISLYGHMYKSKNYADQTSKSKITAEDIAYVTGRYDDGIYGTDEMLQKLFQYLEQSGLDKNTVVVLESEHGEDFGEHGYIAHYDIYNEQVHTPLIIEAPGLHAGHVSAITSSVDVAPTLLSMLGVSYPVLQGRNVFAASTDESEAFIMRTPLWERVGNIVPAFASVDNITHYYDTAVRSGEWELIHRLSRAAQKKYSWWGILTGVPVDLPEYELYNVDRDPTEQNNIYSFEISNPDIERLQQDLVRWEGQVKKEMPGPMNPTIIQPYF